MLIIYAINNNHLLSCLVKTIYKTVGQTSFYRQFLHASSKPLCITTYHFFIIAKTLFGSICPTNFILSNIVIFFSYQACRIYYHDDLGTKTMHSISKVFSARLYLLTLVVTSRRFMVVELISLIAMFLAIRSFSPRYS